MIYSLNSLKGRYISHHLGDHYGGYQGDTRSLDSCSYGGGDMLGYVGIYRV